MYYDLGFFMINFIKIFISYKFKNNMENPRRSSVKKLKEFYERKSATDKRNSRGNIFG